MLHRAGGEEVLCWRSEGQRISRGYFLEAREVHLFEGAGGAGGVAQRC